MGENVWRDEHEWPLARTDWQKWYLHSGGKANTLLGDGALSRAEPADEPTDHFIYHPEYPVPTVGGTPCCDSRIIPWAAHDQRDLEMRADVLCYTTPPLTEDVEVTGPITLTLYAQTDGRDTDWTGKLVDVGVTGNLFKKGHRIRLEVSSSNFPLYDRNLNTGNPLGQDAEIRVAHQTIHHSRAYPSHLTLPVIPCERQRSSS